MASQTRKIDIRQVGDRALVVYALLDPDTEELRYVGATPHLRTRARQHGLRLLNRQHNPLWFRDRATGNYLPVAPNAESVA